MKLVLYPSFIFFEGPTIQEESQIYFKFFVMSHGYKHSEFYQNWLSYMNFKRDVEHGYYKNSDSSELLAQLSKKRMWDGRIYFYNKRKHTLPIGFLDKILEMYDGIEVEDRRKGPIIHNWDFEINDKIEKGGKFIKFEARDYQEQSVLKALEVTNGIFNLAVNAGKTTVFIILSMILRENNVLIITHRKEIMKSIIEKFGSYVNYDGLGIIQSGNISPKSGVTIAMIQTLHNNLETIKPWFESVNVVILDEVHHACSATYSNVLSKCRAKVRLGFTGTMPEREDNYYKTIQFIGPVLGRIDSETLIQKGVSVRPYIKVITVNSRNTSSYEDSIKWNVVYCFERIKHILNISMVHYGEKILIIGDLTSQCRILCDVFDNVGLECCYFHGGVKNREEVVRRFTTGDVKVMVATSVMDEGVDISDIDVIVLAYPRKNYRQTFQRIGRGMRTNEGKTHLVVYDFFDNEDTFLMDHYYRRQKYYIKENFPHCDISLKMICNNIEDCDSIIYKAIETEKEYVARFNKKRNNGTEEKSS